MGIGSITSTNSMSSMQMTSANLKDQKSKSIENEITSVQQQMQKLSSKEELSVNEKANERKNLQKEISSLNTELKQHQEELLRSQKREITLAKLREDSKLADEEKSENKVQAKETSSDQTGEKILPADEQQTGQSGNIIAKNSDGTVLLKDGTDQNAASDVAAETKPADEAQEEAISEEETKSNDSDMSTDSTLSPKEMHTMLSANSSAGQASRLGAVIAKTDDGIAILKGEIKQDERRGIDTERKQAELEKMEKQEEKARTFQFSILGGANSAMNVATETNTVGIKGSEQADTENNAYINALKMSQDEQAQQRFHVSIS